MRVASYAELPEKYSCRYCNTEKPVAEMVVIRCKGKIYVRPLCRKCRPMRGNVERRKENQAAYLRQWRKANPELTREYGRKVPREVSRENGYSQWDKNRAAYLIKIRLRRGGFKVTLEEARQLLKRFGPCYPLVAGLSTAGKRELLRIQKRLGRSGNSLPGIQVRMMIYEDDEAGMGSEHSKLVIRPCLQGSGYPTRGQHMRRKEAA